jgi:hypothetical protein
MKAQAVSLVPSKLLDRLRAEIWVRYYSIRTEETYVDWTRRFILYHNNKHPNDMGADQVRDFLSHLAVECNVSASTQNLNGARSSCVRATKTG